MVAIPRLPHLFCKVARYCRVTHFEDECLDCLMLRCRIQWCCSSISVEYVVPVICTGVVPKVLYTLTCVVPKVAPVWKTRLHQHHGFLALQQSAEQQFVEGNSLMFDFIFNSISFAY